MRQGERLTAGVVWTAMVLATLLLGAAHLPQAAALGGGLLASLVALVLLPTASAGWPSAGCTGSGGSSPP